MVSHSGLLTVMERAARKAGGKLRRDFGEVEHLQVSRKGPADFVSKADEQAEKTLVEELQRARPDWGFLLEEGGVIEGDPTKPRWIIDPLDGTTNFLNGWHYTITIALRRGNQTMCGLVYNPVSDEMFTALKGGGAFLNGERLKVSASTDVAMMCVGTGLPTPNLQLYPGAYDRLDAIRAPIGAVRVVGSAANSCAYVACGRLTGYYEETGFVDTAAGILLVEEAGGIVTDWWGRGPETFERTGVLIVANRATHAFLLENLQGVPRKDPVG